MCWLADKRECVFVGEREKISIRVRDRKCVCVGILPRESVCVCAWESVCDSVVQGE